MESSDGSDVDMATQAQHIWKMLDDMADNNPAAYRKFIDKQLQDGRDQMKPPEPHMCVLAKQVVSMDFHSEIPEGRGGGGPLLFLG